MKPPFEIDGITCTVFYNDEYGALQSFSANDSMVDGVIMKLAQIDRKLAALKLSYESASAIGTVAL
jgi:hypothetical protein